MRRHDRLIKDRETLQSILDNADVCRIAMHDTPFPYIVPLNYGYVWNDQLVLYFHSAPEGRKLTRIRHDNHVCFEIDTGHELVQSEHACDWGMRYKSIIGYGIIEIIDDHDEKIKGLNALMRHYKFKAEQIIYDEHVFKHTAVLKMSVVEFTGKQKI
ncbi:MAG: pyridoxamine 5'-phosphate oxidase family protein [Fibrobacter sp.]|nr:pyridoxamine 5'-phosphate oxidase family protein [Fibrobacter sp.]